METILKEMRAMHTATYNTSPFSIFSYKQARLQASWAIFFVYCSILVLCMIDGCSLDEKSVCDVSGWWLKEVDLSCLASFSGGVTEDAILEICSASSAAAADLEDFKVTRSYSRRSLPLCCFAASLRRPWQRQRRLRRRERSRRQWKRCVYHNP